MHLERSKSQDYLRPNVQNKGSYKANVCTEAVLLSSIF